MRSLKADSLILQINLSQRLFYNIEIYVAQSCIPSASKKHSQICAMKKILLPLATYGSDPTEVAIPWLLLTERGHEVTFATPAGKVAQADTRMLYGENLGIWRAVLKARQDAAEAYEKMVQTAAFQKPLSYHDIHEKDYDALLLPGGHDKGVKEYLESAALQQVVADFFRAAKPVAAICHGVVLAARSKDRDTGRSVLYGYKTTSLLQSQEMAAYNMTRLWLGDYYLTYPGLTVEAEVRNALAGDGDFLSGPTPVLRDDRMHLSRGYTVQDRHYLSARWPGDAYSFGLAFAEMLGG